jgi:hypothetical protein
MDLMSGDDTGHLGLRSTLDRLRPSVEPAEASIIDQRATPEIDLQLATIDVQGRVPLRRAASTMSWSPSREVDVSAHDGILRIVDRAAGPDAITLALDARLRVQLPYGIRAVTRFRPGMRLVVLAVRDEGVAAVPVADLIARLISRP